MLHIKKGYTGIEQTFLEVSRIVHLTGGGIGFSGLYMSRPDSLQRRIRRERDIEKEGGRDREREGGAETDRQTERDRDREI